MYPGAEDVETIARIVSKKSFRHLAAGGISGAENQDTLSGHVLLSRVGLAAGSSQRKARVAATAPASCAAMNPGVSTGRIPAKVSLAARASVTAGLANEVDAVNQYA